MSDVSTTDLVSFRGLGNGETVSTGRLDARTALSGPGGPENITLNLEVQEF